MAKSKAARPATRAGSVQRFCSLSLCLVRVSVGRRAEREADHAEPDQGDAWADVAPAASSDSAEHRFYDQRAAGR